MFSHVKYKSRLQEVEDRILILGAREDKARCEMTPLIEEFDREKGYRFWGFETTAKWLQSRLGLAPESARERVRVARATRRLPRIAAAMRAGRLSYTQARAITRVATVEDEAVWLDRASNLGGGKLENEVREARIKSISENPKMQRSHRSCSIRHLPSGMSRLTADLSSMDAAIVGKALETAGRRVDVSGETDEDLIGSTIPDRRRADALVEIAKIYLSPGHSKDAKRPRDPDLFRILVHIDAQARTARIAGGPLIPESTLDRIIAEASMAAVVTLPTGEKRFRELKSVTTKLRREILARDRVCQFPGCRNSMFIHVHHRILQSRGGTHSSSNLVALCTHHHRVLHRPGFQLYREESGGLAVSTPAGEIRSSGKTVLREVVTA